MEPLILFPFSNSVSSSVQVFIDGNRILMSVMRAANPLSNLYLHGAIWRYIEETSFCYFTFAAMSNPVIFGQLVIGPPGSGKTTYCNGLQQFLKAIGRKVAVVNIDPANDNLPYECAIDISKLVTVDDVMQELQLGPNGGLVYSMEYLEKNLDWLFGQLENYKDHYILFDCPGQVELYTYHNSVQSITNALSQRAFRLCAVHLVDSHYCTDPGNFVAVLLTSLSTMMKLELPHINVLSKVDLIEKYDKLAFGIDFYTEVLDLTYLLDQLNEDDAMKKYKKLNSALVDLIENYGLVSFVPLNIQDKKSVTNVVQAVDKANGYVFGWSQDDKDIQKLLSTTGEADFAYCKNADIRENLM